MPASDLRPHTTDVEQALLGSLLYEPDTIVDVLARIRAEDFFDPVHRGVFHAMVELYEKNGGFDLLTVTDQLKNDDGLQRAGGGAYLAELTTVVPTGANAVRYASLIKNKAVHRAVGTAGDAIAKLSRDENLDATELLERAEQTIFAIARITSESEPETVFDIGSRAYDRYAEKMSADDATPVGVRTDFAGIDALLDQLNPGGLTVIAARPSLGKTSLALNIACNVAEKQQRRVAVFSLEMEKHEILDRILVSKLGAEKFMRFKNGSATDGEMEELRLVVERFQDCPLSIDDDPDTTLANLRSKARRTKLKHGLDLLIIDYLQLIEVRDRTAGESRTQQVSYLSRSLKNLARELGCPIIALSQLSRAVEQRGAPIPILSDLRDSGSIEQDADIVLMLYREDAYNEDCAEPGVTDIYVRKNRNGPTGRVSLFFDAKRMTFRPLQLTGNLPQTAPSNSATPNK